MVDPAHVKNYARILVAHAVGLQPGQDLYIRSADEHSDFVSQIGESGYEIGARSIHYHLTNAEHLAQLIRCGSAEQIALHHDRDRDFYSEILQKGGTLVSLLSHSELPEAIQEAARVNPTNFTLFIQGRQEVVAHLRKPLIHRLFPSTLAPAATPRWARKVFPNLPAEQALSQLWELLVKVSFADQPDALEILAARSAQNKAREQALNALEIREILITGGGNHLKIALSPKSRWRSSSYQTHTGQTFCFNFPSEEIFTAPDRRATEGRLVASRPLRLYDGNVIENLILEFRHGSVTSFEASSGREAFERWLQIDEGARYLGEIGLVSQGSIIGQTGIFFGANNLDENAAAHIALGQSFAFNIESGETLTQAELAALGANRSTIHTDILFGSEDVTIRTTRSNLGAADLMERGQWIESFFTRSRALLPTPAFPPPLPSAHRLAVA